MSEVDLAAIRKAADERRESLAKAAERANRKMEINHQARIGNPQIETNHTGIGNTLGRPGNTVASVLGEAPENRVG